MPDTPSPTPVELAILQALWQRGPSTVRQIHHALANGTGQSTTLKMVQVMTEKGLILKDESVRPQIFRPARPAEQTQLQLVDELIQRAFGGSAADLVMRAASAKRVSTEELAEIKRLIERAKSSKR
jgi:predicted transcriptional regulator